MKQIENHMVVGPDEFDEVVECKHEDWTHGEAEETTHRVISFHITCDSCHEEGYVTYRPYKWMHQGHSFTRPHFDIEVVW